MSTDNKTIIFGKNGRPLKVLSREDLKLNLYSLMINNQKKRNKAYFVKDISFFDEETNDNIDISVFKVRDITSQSSDDFFIIGLQTDYLDENQLNSIPTPIGEAEIIDEI